MDTQVLRLQKGLAITANTWEVELDLLEGLLRKEVT